MGSTETPVQTSFSRTSDLSVRRYAETNLPTRYGVFRLVVYRAADAPDGPLTHIETSNLVEHTAIVRGDVRGDAVLARVHSECFTSEVLHSLKCDCREQLDLGLRRIAEAGRGVVVYLRQEGRGIGLGDKIRAYALQEQGRDTVDANTELGLPEDSRRYRVAADILRDLNVRSVALMTNNPAKVRGLENDGISVLHRVPHHVAPRQENLGYLATKAARMGHVLDLPDSEAKSASNTNDS
ncbi:MAG: GTP cyclohydrolase II [Myxococcota bacterium]